MDKTAYSLMYELEKDHWWFKARRKIVGDMLDDQAPSPNSSRSILDIGCGTGANIHLLSRFGIVTGVDYFDEALAFCRENGFDNVRKDDAHKLSTFEDNSVDLVAALDVLEHVDDGQALTAIGRILKPGGHVVATVPAFKYLWSGHDDVAHHLRRYRKNELRIKFEGAGFRIQKLTYFNTLLFAPVALSRLLKRVLGSDDGPKSDLVMPSQSLNRLLTTIFASERHFLKRARLPFGISIICIAEKSEV